MKDRVELVGMQFYAYHGCFEEEQRIGNKFIVSFWAEADLSLPARTDKAINIAKDLPVFLNLTITIPPRIFL